MKKNVITITENAAKYIAKILEQNDKHALRVSLKKGGCSGVKYHFECSDEKKLGEEEVTEHNVKVIIDQSALLNVIGSMLDYEENNFEAKLVFVNPNEKGRCGCGKSVQF